MIRLVVPIIIIVVFVWFFSTMKDKIKAYAARRRGEDPEDASVWGSGSRPKKAQQARPKAEVIEIEPLRAAREAKKDDN